MTTDLPRGPQLLDEAGQPAGPASKTAHDEPRARPAAAAETATGAAGAGGGASMRGPRIIETDERVNRIDTGWAEAARPVPAPVEPWLTPGRALTLGILVLILGLLGLDLVGFVLGQFDRAVWLGCASLAVVATGIAGIAGIGYWLVAEVRAIVALRSVDELRQALTAGNTDIVTAKRWVMAWLGALRGPDVPEASVRRSLETAASLEQIRSILERDLLPSLDSRAAGVCKAATMQMFGMATFSPKGASDAALFLLRTVGLVHEVADIYGLRPGWLATWALLRRMTVNASVVGASDLLGDIVGQVLFTNEWAKKLAGEVVGATVAAQRMTRLGQVVIATCRVLPLDAAKSG
jgi:putative membrane protein